MDKNQSRRQFVNIGLEDAKQYGEYGPQAEVVSWYLETALSQLAKTVALKSSKSSFPILLQIFIKRVFT